MANEQFVTPEWLLAHGFKELQPLDIDNFPSNFDVDWNSQQRCFIETDFHRNLFCVVLDIKGDDQEGYCFKVYVQNNVGMGFLELPLQWSALEIDRLNDLYSGFMDKKLS
jgi:hypothetical protein